MADWVPACAAAELPRGEARTFTRGDDHVALFHTDAGLFAVDARCPHEGYPLVKGDVAGCTLTCIWHNYKFDLRDGRCVLGDEDVRTYPLRVVDGRIEIDVTAPPREAAIASRWPSLEGAIARRRIGQAARDVVRLLRLGVAPAEIALAAARYDAAHGEYGPSHAMPAAADVAAIARRRRDALALLPAFEMAAESAAYRPRRARVRFDGDVTEDALREAVRVEDAPRAEAIVAAAIARGLARDVIEAWVFDLACAHFVDFGHWLIYAGKAFELLDEVGWARADELLPAWTYGLVLGTREDLLPEWLWFQRRLAAVEPRLGELAQVAPRAVSDEEIAALAAVIADGAREAAFDAVTTSLERGIPPARICDALVLAASQVLLRFDVAIDRDPTIQEDWLSVTHTLTYASAARVALARLARPSALRTLWFAARFVNVSRALDGAAPPLEASGVAAPVVACVEATARRDDAAALAHATEAVRAGASDALADALEDWMLASGATRPIVLAHQVKTLRAARAEAAIVGPMPLLATARFLAAPLVERRAAQLVHEAERFLVDGKVPRTLT